MAGRPGRGLAGLENGVVLVLEGGGTGVVRGRAGLAGGGGHGKAVAPWMCSGMGVGEKAVRVIVLHPGFSVVQDAMVQFGGVQIVWQTWPGPGGHSQSLGLLPKFGVTVTVRYYY